jgi:hypothetical protein
MYGHPSFVRGLKDRLSELRKLTSKPTTGAVVPKRAITHQHHHRMQHHRNNSTVHIVPPSPPPSVSRMNDAAAHSCRFNNIPSLSSSFNGSGRAAIPPMLPRDTSSKGFAPFPCLSSRGRLDLLTLALEHEALIEPASSRAVHSL